VARDDMQQSPDQPSPPVPLWPPTLTFKALKQLRLSQLFLELFATFPRDPLDTQAVRKRLTGKECGLFAATNKRVGKREARTNVLGSKEKEAI